MRQYPGMASRSRQTLIGLTALLVLAALALEVYTRWPSPAMTAALDLPEDTRYAVLLFHGSHGKDEPLLRQIAAEAANLVGGNRNTVVRHYVWSPWSDNRLRAGIHGRTIGRQLGRELAAMEQMVDLRLIVHSAGAYILDPLCEMLRESDSTPPHIEMTFLDGMGIRGGWDYTYGYRHYGECADFSAAIFNSDETTPGTNAPAEPSWSIDVTGAPNRSDINGHLWPLEYFLSILSRDEITPRGRNHEDFPRGEVLVVGP
jgi:hypothetical protein